MKPVAKTLGDLTTQCIRCGFCLESCPTFVVTGDESKSPRGRIYLIRSVEENQLKWNEESRVSIDTCLGCRACETACPSGVQYGEILELARSRMSPKPGHKLLVNTVSNSTLLKLAQKAPGKMAPAMFSKEEPQAWKPKIQPANFPPMDEDDLPEIIGEVYLLEGCAMKVLFPRVHQATRRLLRRLGFAVREVKESCCGALHAHAGFLDEAEKRAQHLAQTFADNLPIVVNSAGCGSTMKEYGQVVGKGQEFVAQRTHDASEFLWKIGLELLLKDSPGIEASVTYHDACHLAHGQKITNQPRELIKAIPGIRFKEMNESDMCCGSAGTYNVTNPTMARQLLERKWKNVEDSGAQIVVTGNPGCHAWIAQAAEEHGKKVQVFHTIELLEASFCGLPT